MKKVFLAASGAFGSIPGITVLMTGLLVPPGQNIIFGSIVEILGVLTILILWVNKGKIERWSQKRVTKWSIGLGIGFVFCLVFYFLLFSEVVVKATDPIYADQPDSLKTVFFPFWLTGDLAKRVEQEGSRIAVVNKYGPQPIRKAVDSMPNSSNYKAWTTAILVFLYQGVFTLLTVTFGILGCYLKQEPKAK
jgi:hypothetical protein